MHVIGDISDAIDRIESLSFCALRRFHYVVRLLFATWNSYWRPTSFEEQITIGAKTQRLRELRATSGCKWQVVAHCCKRSTFIRQWNGR